MAEVVITMDADLQDDPNEIPSLFNKIDKENFDLVSGWKKKKVRLNYIQEFSIQNIQLGCKKNLRHKFK